MSSGPRRSSPRCILYGHVSGLATVTRWETIREFMSKVVLCYIEGIDGESIARVTTVSDGGTFKRYGARRMTRITDVNNLVCFA